MPPSPSLLPLFLIGEKTLNGSSIKVTSPAAPPRLSPPPSLSLSPDPKVYFSTIFSATDCECAAAANKFHTRMLLFPPPLLLSLSSSSPGGPLQFFNKNEYIWPNETEVGRFFDKQTAGGRPTKSTHLESERERGGGGGRRRRGGRVEAVKPEIEKERMANATAGRTRTDGRTTAFNFSGQCVETPE